MDCKKILKGFVWWVGKTKPHQEFIAEKNLRRQGFTTFCPIFNKEIKRGNQFQIKAQPLFTGYLFIHADDFAQKNIHLTRCTRGLNSLLKINEFISFVTPEIIYELKSNQININASITSHFKPGSSVKITSGKFKGIEGIYQKDSGADRAIVLLSIIQKETKVNLRKQDLIKN